MRSPLLLLVALGVTLCSTGCTAEGADDADDATSAVSGTPSAALDAERARRARPPEDGVEAQLREHLYAAYRASTTHGIREVAASRYPCLAVPSARTFEWVPQFWHDDSNTGAVQKLRDALERHRRTDTIVIVERPGADGKKDLAFYTNDKIISVCSRETPWPTLTCTGVGATDGPTRTQCKL